MRSVNHFDTVNFHPDRWHFHAKGVVISGDDLGAYTFTAQKDGWYYVESGALGNMRCSYVDLPPDVDPNLATRSDVEISRPPTC